MEAALFYIFALGALVAGAQVVLRRNPIYGAISLVGAFFFLAGLYVLLAAHLIAILQDMGSFSDLLIDCGQQRPGHTPELRKAILVSTPEVFEPLALRHFHQLLVKPG